LPALLLTVRPHIWETGWFPLLVGLLVVGLLAAVLRVLERRRFRRRLALLETQNAVARERLRISQDMHDHIGGILTQVTMLSDLGQGNAEAAPSPQFERIGQQARSATQALDEIVWATNPKNDNLPRFAEYVSRYADEFFENSPVRCWQEVPTDLPALALRADLRHNVFLAIKEAFNNVLKHAHAPEVWLRISCGDREGVVEIEDRGRGFDPGAGAGTGNGLNNMKSRLEESGGRLELTSEPGKGARIRFRFPLGNPS
jgi:signal transduction histidine kinase